MVPGSVSGGFYLAEPSFNIAFVSYLTIFLIKLLQIYSYIIFIMDSETNNHQNNLSTFQNNTNSNPLASISKPQNPYSPSSISLPIDRNIKHSQHEVSGRTIHHNQYHMVFLQNSDKSAVVKVFITFLDKKSKSNILNSQNIGEDPSFTVLLKNERPNNQTMQLYGILPNTLNNENLMENIRSGHYALDQYTNLLVLKPNTPQQLSLKLTEMKVDSPDWKKQLVNELNTLRQKLRKIKTQNNHIYKSQHQNLKASMTTEIYESLNSFKCDLVNLVEQEIIKVKDQFRYQLKQAISQTRQTYQKKLKHEIDDMRFWIKTELSNKAVTPKTPQQKNNPENYPQKQHKGQQQNNLKQQQIWQINENIKNQPMKSSCVSEEPIIEDICYKQPMEQYIIKDNDIKSKSFQPFTQFSNKFMLPSLKYLNLRERINPIIQSSEPKEEIVENKQSNPQPIKLCEEKADLSQSSRISQGQKPLPEKGNRIWNCYGRYAGAHKPIIVSNPISSSINNYDDIINNSDINIDFLSKNPLNDNGQKTDSHPSGAQDSSELRLKSILELLEFFEPNYNASAKMLSRIF